MNIRICEILCVISNFVPAIFRKVKSPLLRVVKKVINPCVEIGMFTIFVWPNRKTNEHPLQSAHQEEVRNVVQN